VCDEVKKLRAAGPFIYPHLKKEGLISTPTSTILAPAELLDLATVIKISQAVADEMVLEKLIDGLMRAAIEHAGAERGLLILPRGGELQIQAEATTSGKDVTVHLRSAADSTAALPESVVRYVMRTQEPDATSLERHGEARKENRQRSARRQCADALPRRTQKGKSCRRLVQHSPGTFRESSWFVSTSQLNA
jgi:hypothetical protein